jgi:WD40 repeat protein
MITRLLCTGLIGLFTLFIPSATIAQNCPEYAQLIKEGDQFAAEKNFQKALKKFNAAKLCEPKKAKDVDVKINGVFEAIEREKDNALIAKLDADKQRVLALKAEEEAWEAQKKSDEAKEKTEILLDRANGFYWSNEANNLVPKQGLRLLEHGIKQIKDKEANLALRSALVRLFNNSNSHQLHEIIRPVKFDIDDNLIAFFDSNNDTIILNCVTGDFIQSIDWDQCSGLSPDGKWLILWNPKGFYSLWNTEEKSNTFVTEQDSNLQNLIFSSNGQWLATLDDKHNLRIWDVTTKTPEIQIENFEMVNFIEITNDGKYLCFNDSNSRMSVVGFTSENSFNLMTSEMNIHNGYISYDGKLFICSRDDMKISILDLASNSFNDLLVMNADTAAIISSNHENYVRIEYEGELRNIIEIRTNREPINFKKLIDFTIHYNDANGVLSAYDDKHQFVIFDLLKGVRTILTRPFSAIDEVGISKDRNWLLLTVSDNSCEIWDLSSATLKYEFDYSEYSEIWFAERSNWLCLRKYDFLNVLDLYSGELINFTNNLELSNLNFSQNGQYSIVTRYEDGAISCWNSDLNRNYDVLEHGYNPENIFFSPQGNYAVLRGRYNNFDIVLDLKTGLQFDQFGYKGLIANVQFSQDEKLLISNENGNYIIFDIKNNYYYDFLKRDKEISKVFFTNNDNWIGVLHIQGDLKLIELDNANSLVLRKHLLKQIERIEFSSDQNWLLIHTADRCSLYRIKAGQAKKLNTYRDAFFIRNNIIAYNEYSRDVITGYWNILNLDNNVGIYYEDMMMYSLSTQLYYCKDNILALNSSRFYGMWNLESGLKIDIPNNEFIIVLSHDSINNLTLISDNIGNIFLLNLCDMSLKFVAAISMTAYKTIAKSKKWVLFELMVDNERTILVVDLELNSIKYLKIQDRLDQKLNYKLFSDYLVLYYSKFCWVYNLNNGCLELNVALNKNISNIVIMDDLHMYIDAGKTVTRLNLEDTKGAVFSWGDSEPLDYTLEEINEWIRLFGDEYLGPLSEEVIEKYGLDVKN